MQGTNTGATPMGPADGRHRRPPRCRLPHLRPRRRPDQQGGRLLRHRAHAHATRPAGTSQPGRHRPVPQVRRSAFASTPAATRSRARSPSRGSRSSPTTSPRSTRPPRRSSWTSSRTPATSAPASRPVGKRNWTFSAWESVEVAESALSRGAHAQAMALGALRRHRQERARAHEHLEARAAQQLRGAGAGRLARPLRARRAVAVADAALSCEPRYSAQAVSLRRAIGSRRTSSPHPSLRA